LEALVEALVEAMDIPGPPALVEALVEAMDIPGPPLS